MKERSQRLLARDGSLCLVGLVDQFGWRRDQSEGYGGSERRGG